MIAAAHNLVPIIGDTEHYVEAILAESGGKLGKGIPRRAVMGTRQVLTLYLGTGFILYVG